MQHSVRHAWKEGEGTDTGVVDGLTVDIRQPLQARRRASWRRRWVCPCCGTARRSRAAAAGSCRSTSGAPRPTSSWSGTGGRQAAGAGGGGRRRGQAAGAGGGGRRSRHGTALMGVSAAGHGHNLTGHGTAAWAVCRTLQARGRAPEAPQPSGSVWPPVLTPGGPLCCVAQVPDGHLLRQPPRDADGPRAATDCGRGAPGRRGGGWRGVVQCYTAGESRGSITGPRHSNGRLGLCGRV